VGVEDHLLGLARIGPQERHPAMAKPHVCDLGHRRHPVNDDAFVAPVELIGLARRKAERHIGFRLTCGVPALPGPTISANRVIAALVALQPKFLEQPLISQTLAPTLAGVLRQHRVETYGEGAKLRQRLIAALIPPFRLPAPHDVAHRVPRQAKLTRDPLDPVPLHQMRMPYPTDRIHRHHPRSAPARITSSRKLGPRRVGSNLHADHPATGVKIACRFTDSLQIPTTRSATRGGN